MPEIGRFEICASTDDSVAQEPLDGIVRIYAEKLLEMAGAEPFSVEKIVEFNSQSIPIPPEPLPLSMSAQLAQALAEAGLEGKLSVLSDK